MKLKTEQKIPLILFVVFLVLTMFGIAFYQSTISFQQAVEFERRSSNVQTLTDEIFTTCLDAETGVRGFMFTNVDTYLSAYERAKLVSSQNLTKLRSLAADDRELTAAIDKLDSAVAEFLNGLNHKIEIRKSQGYEGSIQEIIAPMDKTRLDSLRFSVNAIKNLESDKQRQRDESFGSGLNRTIWILIIGSLIGIIGLLLANLVVYRAIQKRQSAEEALIETNKNLEAKVKERTIELESVNERLVAIGAERELLLDNEKKAREEAEVANRLRDEFMATISHELRTPLNSILGWARLLREGSLNNEQSERAIATIIKSSETQNRLIEDLLDVARIISGKLELDKKKLDLIGIISHAVEAARPNAAGREIDLRLRLDVESELYVLGDRSRLDQVFSNLLANAVKFTNPGGFVEVNASLVDQTAVVSIKDNGIGISADFLPLVFERFRQDKANAGRNGGLGLGLAIVRNLVEMHGGSVLAESEGKDKGSCFTVRLPVYMDE
ncbi:MAG TPA: ATP-binding protein [Pyrinomonadaceae bacterium]|nr:ATP-binding protein [Pyrinomonadaceae bacterium]